MILRYCWKLETERSSTEPKRKKTVTENSKKESNYWKRDLGNEKTDFIWRYPVGDRAGPDPGSTEGPNAGAGVGGQGPWAQYINRSAPCLWHTKCVLELTALCVCYVVCVSCCVF